MVGREIERGFQDRACPVDGRRYQALDQTITPPPQIGRREQRDGCPAQVRCQVRSYSFHIAKVAAARPQVGLVGIEGLTDLDRPRGYGSAIPMGKRTDSLLRLPKIENAVAIRILVIVGEADHLRPVPTPPVCEAPDPGPGGLV